jgi:DNA-binding GntR family transcriptional regulator
VTVSEDDPRPSYVQVADDLRRAIERGEYQPGQRLPSGRAIASQYKVALNTAQRAVDLLKAEGVLISYPPRGVFVRSPSEEPERQPRHSPEYVEITRQINELRSALHDQMSMVDRRLSSLEQAIDDLSGASERDS